MTLHHLKFALRNLGRNKLFSSISIGGLAVSLTAFLLMALYIENELSYDRFNANAAAVYRVTDDKVTNALRQHAASSPAPLAPALLRNFPEIREAVRIINTQSLVNYRDKLVQERNIFFADPGIFTVFSLGVCQGDSAQALKSPNSVVLTRSTAERYFGSAPAVGKLLLFDKTPMKVTAVVRDVPANAHWHFDILVSMSTAIAKGSGYDWLFSNWYSNEFYTYLLLPDPAAAARLARRLDALAVSEKANTLATTHHFSLEKLTDIYLHSDRENQVGKTGSLSGIYVFSAVAVFILLLACINFVNLSTARATERAKEVAIKKVNGVGRPQLIAQFFLESFLMATIALLLAILFTYALLPVFNHFSGKNLPIDILRPAHLILLSGLLMTSSGVSGIYPAIVLSGFDPIEALKGRFRSSTAGLAVRKGLVVFQFSISIVLIICSIVVYLQLRFMQNHDLGFDRTQTMVINFEGDGQVQAQAALIRQRFLGLKGVTAVSASSNVPGDLSAGGWSMEFARKTGDTIHAEMPIYLTDFHFMDQYHIPIVAGRGLSPLFAADTAGSMIINETALHKLGFRRAQDAIGVKVGMYPSDGRVVGIFRDFHFESLQKAIEPLAMRVLPDKFRLFSLQVREKNLKTTIAEIEAIWRTMAPQRPMEYSFLNETFDRQYAAEMKFGQLFSVFTSLAVGIACFGLFGLVLYSVRQRTKEIGIRKVVGASVIQIVRLLSKDFLYLILSAVFIATPVAYYAMQTWTGSFAYRVPLHWWIFVGAAAIALLTGVVTVSYQAIRAALANPARSLRSE